MNVISERNVQIFPLQGDSCVSVRPPVIENRAIKSIVFVEEMELDRQRNMLLNKFNT